MPTWLVEVSGERAGQIHALEPPRRITIGRGPDNSIVVPNGHLSRMHAIIWCDEERCWVEDHGTKNGTLLNGLPIAGSRELRDGDEVLVPGLRLAFRKGDETMTFTGRGLQAGGDTKTFLFSDLRGYTSFVERHGDDAAGELIADYRGLVRAEVKQADGAEIKTEGDSFFVVFDSAKSALECAIAIVQAVERRSRERPDRPMWVGVGVHTGETVGLQHDFVGSAVNLAARLAQNAGANEVLVSEVVRALIRTSGLPPMTLREGLVLKGIDDPPRIYALALGTPTRPAQIPQ